MININYKSYFQAVVLSLLSMILAACGAESADTSSNITSRSQYETAQLSLTVSSANKYSAQFATEDISSINIRIDNGPDTVEVLTLTRDTPQVSIALSPGSYQLTANLLDEAGNILATGTVELSNLQGGERYSANIPLSSIPAAVINANLDSINVDTQERLLLDPNTLVDPEFKISLNAQTSDADIISYEWDIIKQSTQEGTSVEFEIADGSSTLTASGENTTVIYAPSYTLDLTAGIEDTFTVRLTVNNDDGESSSSEMTFTVLYIQENELPVAKINITSLDSVLGIAEIDGTESYDTDGSIDGYAWEITSQSETITALTLTNESTASPSLNWTGEESGNIKLTLTVTDNDGATSTKSSTIIINPVPVATIITHYDDVVVDEQNRILLNPSLLLEDELAFQLAPDSSDESIVSYSWEVVEQSLVTNTSVEFNTNTNNGNGNGNNNGSLTTSGLLAKVNYFYSTAVNLSAGVEDTFTIRLTVANQYGETSFAEKTFTVLYTQDNQPPIAIIESPTGIDTQAGSTFVDGGASSDPEGAISSFFWQISSTTGDLTASLNDSASSMPTLSWTSGQLGTIELALTVTDSNDVATTTSTTIAVSQTPTAEYSWYVFAVDLVNDGLPFDATDSTDPGGETLTYTWDLSGTDAINFTMINYGDGTANLFWLLEEEDPKNSQVTVTLTATNESGLSDTYIVEFTIK